MSVHVCTSLEKLFGLPQKLKDNSGRHPKCHASRGFVAAYLLSLQHFGHVDGLTCWMKSRAIFASRACPKITPGLRLYFCFVFFLFLFFFLLVNLSGVPCLEGTSVTFLFTFLQCFVPGRLKETFPGQGKHKHGSCFACQAFIRVGTLSPVFRHIFYILPAFTQCRSFLAWGHRVVCLRKRETG